MILKRFILVFIFLLFGCASKTVDADLSGTDNAVFDYSFEQLLDRYGKPDFKWQNIMPDNVQFMIVYYSVNDVSFVIDVSRNKVCGISLGMDKKGYCYPCSYEAGLCH